MSTHTSRRSSLAPVTRDATSTGVALEDNAALAVDPRFPEVSRCRAVVRSGQPLDLSSRLLRRCCCSLSCASEEEQGKRCERDEEALHDCGSPWTVMYDGSRPP